MSTGKLCFGVILLAACDGGTMTTPPPVDDLASLTDGVTVQPAGCPYSVRTPAQTTPPVMDDGKTPPAGTTPPYSLHLGWTGTTASPSTSMTVVWNTGVLDRSSRVEFGTAAAFGQSAAGFSYAYPTDLNAGDPPSVRVHQVHLCNLTPGTTYQYRVVVPGQAPIAASFTTAPDGKQPGKPVRFAVLGDSRDSAPVFGQLLKAAASDGAAFVVYTGDAVLLGTIQSAWDAWFAAGKDTLPSLPMVFAFGNHEASARHAFAQVPTPDQGSGNGQWYALDYGDLHLTVLDDTPAMMATIAGEQKSFLDDDLGKTSLPWKLVVHHRAIFSSGERHGSQMDLQAAWMPLYDAHGVDVVFNSHDHILERTLPMKAGKPVSDGSAATTYFVNGGGGATLDTPHSSAFTAFSASAYAFTRVDVMGKTLTATTMGLTPAMQLDQVVIGKK